MNNAKSRSDHGAVDERQRAKLTSYGVPGLCKQKVEAELMPGGAGLQDQLIDNERGNQKDRTRCDEGQEVGEFVPRPETSDERAYPSSTQLLIGSRYGGHAIVLAKSP